VVAIVVAVGALNTGSDHSSESDVTAHASTMPAKAILSDATTVNENLASNAIPNLRLKGLLLESQRRLAYVSIDGLNERVYTEAQEILPGVRLAKIRSKSILVTAMGREFEYHLSADASDAQEQVLDQNLAFITRKLAKYPDRQSPEYINKLLDYIAGRQLAAVEFPLGVSSYGIDTIDESHYVMSLAAIQDQVSSEKPFRHIAYDFKQNVMTINSVVPGSLYDKCGLQPGDRILSIQDKKVTGLWDIAYAYQALTQDEGLKIHIDRNGVKQELKFQIY